MPEDYIFYNLSLQHMRDDNSVGSFLKYISNYIINIHATTIHTYIIYFTV